jgi:branched-subunit amino acid aminotransferase/4-amino-4-deoxychorismate lyase
MAADAEFSLIETILWTKSSGYVLLQYHLRRLAASAACMGFPCDLREIVRALNACSEETDNLSSEQFWKIRLLVAPDGTLSVSATPIEPPSHKEPLPLAVISTTAVSSTDPILRHKTTRRALYDAELKAWSARTGCFDIIFLN